MAHGWCRCAGGQLRALSKNAMVKLQYRPKSTTFTPHIDIHISISSLSTCPKFGSYRDSIHAMRSAQNQDFVTVSPVYSQTPCVSLSVEECTPCLNVEGARARVSLCFLPPSSPTCNPHPSIEGSTLLRVSHTHWQRPGMDCSNQDTP